MFLVQLDPVFSYKYLIHLRVVHVIWSNLGHLTPKIFTRRTIDTEFFFVYLTFKFEN